MAVFFGGDEEEAEACESDNVDALVMKKDSCSRSPSPGHGATSTS